MLFYLFIVGFLFFVLTTNRLAHYYRTESYQILNQVRDYLPPATQCTAHALTSFQPPILALLGPSERDASAIDMGLISTYNGGMADNINPFKSLRLKEGATLGEVATYARIDIRAVSRSEHGLYSRPLPALVDYWVNKGVISEGILVTEYEDYQIAHRRRNHRCFGNDLSFDLSNRIHPLRQLRAKPGYQLLEFCKALCLPLDTIQYFEKKWRVQISVPKGLLLALNQCGYSRLELKEFQDSYAHWRSSQNPIKFT
jgi:transcriptional regulator with XRE-family HTH domain